jgi:hypothetical protein
MKWMEDDLLAGGEKFSILGLELSYSKAKIETLFQQMDDRVRTILRYHLYFDFAFMAGVYPGILAGCMLVRKNHGWKVMRQLLLVAGLAQFAAWVADIAENYFLLSWSHRGVASDEFTLYHFIVGAKWLIALGGIVMALAGIGTMKISRKQPGTVV